MEKVQFKQDVKNYMDLIENEDGDSERYPFVVGLIKGTFRDKKLSPADKLNQITAILEAHENVQGT